MCYTGIIIEVYPTDRTLEELYCQRDRNTHREIYTSATLFTTNSTCPKIMAGKTQRKKSIGRSVFICVDYIKYILRVIGCKNINCWTKKRSK
jgi:hypothetical protein